MKHFFSVMFFAVLWVLYAPLYAQKDYSSTPSVGNSVPANKQAAGKQLFIDVHHLPPGKITVEGVAAAHAKDLATEGKYGVQFLNYWVDTAKGAVYCLSLASDSGDIVKTHAQAHGLLPDQIYAVQAGNQAALLGGKNLYLDVHELGAGHVTAADVAGAHQKDLAVQGKYGVNFINYWVNEKDGVVMCLSEAPDSGAIIKTHKEAHGLLPKYVLEVKQGQ
jgi:Nickel responsive protein SCO4226-like